MPKNYLIGIGGTGARVVEAVVNMCAAGLGPDELSIFLVDPDSGNGNLTRTTSLITQYIKCRNALQRSDANPLYKTEIHIPSDEKGLVWSIFPEKDHTLAKFINYENMKENNPDLADLASILFSNTELETQLNEGFRGHPSIGSVVMANPPQDEFPFKMLWDDIADRKPNDVRVFLAGSVFGGTGAAGFPTLSSRQIMKFHPKAKVNDNLSRILLGGAMVLPYFTFELDSNTDERMFVTAADFPIATKAALQYYNEKDLGFDQLYFIGDSLNQKVGKFGVGAKKQENLPHYIELVSALSAFDFYAQPEIKDAPEKKLFTACRDGEQLKWDSLPVSRDENELRSKQTSLKTLLLNMTAFSYAFLTYGKKILNTNHKDIHDSWYREYFTFKEKDEKEKAKDPRFGDSKKELDDFESFLSSFLFWICALDDKSNKIDLIDRSKLIQGDLEIGKEFKLFNPEMEVTSRNIGNLLKNENSKCYEFNKYKTLGLDDVKINQGKITTASSKFVNIFYEGAAKFNSLNY